MSATLSLPLPRPFRLTHRRGWDRRKRRAKEKRGKAKAMGKFAHKDKALKKGKGKGAPPRSGKGPPRGGR